MQKSTTGVISHNSLSRNNQNLGFIIWTLVTVIKIHLVLKDRTPGAQAAQWQGCEPGKHRTCSWKEGLRERGGMGTEPYESHKGPKNSGR